MAVDIYSNITNGVRLLDIDDKHLMVWGGRGDGFAASLLYLNVRYLQWWWRQHDGCSAGYRGFGLEGDGHSARIIALFIHYYFRSCQAEGKQWWMSPGAFMCVCVCEISASCCLANISYEVMRPVVNEAEHCKTPTAHFSYYEVNSCNLEYATVQRQKEAKVPRYYSTIAFWMYTMAQIHHDTTMAF